MQQLEKWRSEKAADVFVKFSELTNKEGFRYTHCEFH